MFRRANFFFGIINFKKHITHYSNITMKYEYCSNIPFIRFWTDFARFLIYFRNLSNSFINILAILQDFNGIFLKFFLNITVLCGYLPDQILSKTDKKVVLENCVVISTFHRFVGLWAPINQNFNFSIFFFAFLFRGLSFLNLMSQDPGKNSKNRQQNV